MNFDPILVYVIGPTNAGKSTFLAHVGKFKHVGLVEVGKMMRAKYPPSHFAGQSNPAHTAAEAWQMYLDGVEAHKAAGKSGIYIDGQPRDTKQTLELLRVPYRNRVFLHLWAPLEVRQARAEARDKDDPAKLELSRQRLVNDDPQVYNVVSRLEASHSERVVHVDTSAPDLDWESIRQLLDSMALELC